MNLQNMLDPKTLVSGRDQFKKIFFYRICGTGMGATACLLKEAGFEVTGCDASFSPPMSTYLDSIGIECLPIEVVDAQLLKNYDLIVVGNSVPRDSKFATLIEDCGVPFTSFPTVLGNLVLKDKNVIGVAGTHGKTTTTFFMTQMLEALGENPGYLIGGIIDGRPPSQIGDSKFFVIESDEYDSAYFQKYAKFQQYHLNHMILTSLEFDHADIYNNVKEIEDQFELLLEKMPAGKIIANSSYESILQLSEKYPGWSLYSEDSEKGPKVIRANQSGTEFKLCVNNEWHVVDTNLVGIHNILNLSSCILMLTELGFAIEDVIKSSKKLKMVKRRQEVRGEYRGATVIDDFAHHPRAITLTIEAMKMMFPGKEVLTVFEPVSATSRSDIFQKEFAKSLELSDKIIIARNPLNTTVKGHNNLDCELIVKDANAKNVPAICVNNLEDLQKQIDQWVHPEQVLLVLSNRTCLGLWESDFVKNLH